MSSDPYRSAPRTEERPVEPLVGHTGDYYGSPPSRPLSSPPRQPFTRPDLGAGYGSSGYGSAMRVSSSMAGSYVGGQGFTAPIASPGYGAAHVGAISPTRAYLKPKHGSVEAPTQGLRSRSSRKQPPVDAGPDFAAPVFPRSGSVSRAPSIGGGGGFGVSPNRRSGSFDDAPPTESMDMMDDLLDHSHMGVSGGSSTRMAENALALRDDPFDYSPPPALQSGGAWATWVVVFGFPRDLMQSVMDQFKYYGQVVEQQEGGGNWLLVRYATRQQADKAAAQNGSLLRTTRAQDQVLLGVSRLNAELMRKLGVTSNGQTGAIEVSRRDDRVGSYTLPPNSSFPSRLTRHQEPRLGRTYTVNDQDLLRPATRRRSLVQVLWMLVCWLFGWR